MAQGKTTKSKTSKPKRERKPMDPETARRLRAVGKHLLIALAVFGSCGAGLYYARTHVEQKLTFSETPPAVLLKNRPAWMSDFLAEQIAKTAQPVGAHSSFDHQMLVDAEKSLRNNPWIRQVHRVRRVYGQRPGDTLEIDCEYRTPIALVHWGEYYWLVDTEGYKLPEQFTAGEVPKIVVGRDRKMNIRIIEGIKNPPPGTGERWQGEDLRAGIEMVKLLFGRPYTEEVVKVDVANFDGRKDDREAHLVLVTKYGSQIRWGRPVNARDFFVEVPASRKLKYLQQVFEQKKRVDGGFSWIDVRFDAITHPVAEAPQAEASTKATKSGKPKSRGT